MCPEEAIGKSSAQSATAPSPTNATSTEQSSASVEENSSAGCAPSPTKPGLYTVWDHKSGRQYMVLGFASEESTDDRYPVTVIYADRDGKVWSRPLARWDESMKPATAVPPGLVDVILARANPWYHAVTDACCVATVNWHFDNPRQTLNDLINHHVQIALDPEVSSDARDLMQKGRDEILNGETKACYDEGCPHHGKAIRCEPRPGGCTATLPSQAVSWDAVNHDLKQRNPLLSTHRYPVCGGWLAIVNGIPVFIPDPTHSWE